MLKLTCWWHLDTLNSKNKARCTLVKAQFWKIAFWLIYIFGLVSFLAN